MSATQTRGERNNNPGNLNHGGGFRGEIGLELIPPGKSFSPRFARFDDAENGIRAIAMQMFAYRKRGIRTIRAIINTYAPPADGNKTNVYVQNAARAVGVLPDVPLDIADMDILPRLVRAIITQENGRCIYSDELIETACRDALGTLIGVHK